MGIILIATLRHIPKNHNLNLGNVFNIYLLQQLKNLQQSVHIKKSTMTLFCNTDISK